MKKRDKKLYLEGLEYVIRQSLAMCGGCFLGMGVVYKRWDLAIMGLVSISIVIIMIYRLLKK